MRIRRMEMTDVPQAAAIEREIFPDPWSERGFQDSLANPDTDFLVAVEGEDVIGYIGMYLSFEEGEIVNVAVAPDARRRGVGSRLMEEILAEGQRLGVMRYILEVRVSKDTAVALYEKYGFIKIGVRRDFYTSPREDAYVMTAEIPIAQQKE